MSFVLTVCTITTNILSKIQPSLGNIHNVCAKMQFSQQQHDRNRGLLTCSLALRVCKWTHNGFWYLVLKYEYKITRWYSLCRCLHWQLQADIFSLNLTMLLALYPCKMAPRPSLLLLHSKQTSWRSLLYTSPRLPLSADAYPIVATGISFTTCQTS